MGWARNINVAIFSYEVEIPMTVVYLYYSSLWYAFIKIDNDAEITTTLSH